MPKLQITLQDGTESVQELTEPTIVIGRHPECTAVIADGSVSSRHAQLTASSGDYLFKDIGSTNGSRLNGKTIASGEEHPLHNGDSIRLGNVICTYVSEILTQSKSLPDAAEAVGLAASSSVEPADFANASPFQTKKKKKQPAAVAVMVMGVVAILAIVGALVAVFTLQPPI